VLRVINGGVRDGEEAWVLFIGGLRWFRGEILAVGFASGAQAGPRCPAGFSALMAASGDETTRVVMGQLTQATGQHETRRVR
jgi:hypothetical protein